MRRAAVALLAAALAAACTPTPRSACGDEAEVERLARCAGQSQALAAFASEKRVDPATVAGLSDAAEARTRQARACAPVDARAVPLTPEIAEVVRVPVLSDRADERFLVAYDRRIAAARSDSLQSLRERFGDVLIGRLNPAALPPPAACPAG